MFKLFHGNEQYLSIQGAKDALEQLKEKYPDWDIKIIEAETEDSGLIIDQIITPDLFSPGKIIYLKRLYSNKDRENLLPTLLEQLATLSNTYILIWEDQKINAVTKYIKFFKEKKALEEFNKLNKRQFVSWLKEELQKKGIEMANPAIYLLSEYSNYTPERVMSEIAKFDLLDKDEIMESDIRELISNTQEFDIWKFLDALNGKNKAEKPISIMEKLLKQGEDPMYMLAMINRNFRQLVQVKDLREKGRSSKEIASALRVPPFTVPSLISASENMAKKKLYTLYEKLTSLDYQIKTGQIDAQLGLTLLVAYL